MEPEKLGIMTDFERFAKALALTETHDNEQAWGDAKDKRPVILAGHNADAHLARGANFMAAGRWQMHPAFVSDWWPPDREVGDSWDEVFRATLEHFWDNAQVHHLAATHVAMMFHLGERAYQLGRWDQEYAVRFEGFFHRLGEPETA